MLKINKSFFLFHIRLSPLSSERYLTKNETITVDQCLSTFFKLQNLWNVNDCLAGGTETFQTVLFIVFQATYSKALAEPLGFVKPGLKNTVCFS